MTPPFQPVRIWCLVGDQSAHVKPVELSFGKEAQFIYDEDGDPARLVAQKPHLVLCVNDYPCDVVRCLDTARKARIPSLVLQDGILEWRCQYENPLFGLGGGAPQHQPVLADKIACIGHHSARHIAAWGNAAKVEVTGMPRLDYLLNRPAAPIQNPGTRLLVMTAKNPGFTAGQRELTFQSLRDLKGHLEGLPAVKTLWRVSKSMAAALGVANQFERTSSMELAEVVDHADAVISTLSTAILEAMLLGRPVAALDYHNVPRFQPTAWTIAAPSHIPGVVAELLNPSAAKMAFQMNCLADSLEHARPAAERVRSLILQMIATAKEQPGPTLHLEPDLLGSGQTYHLFLRPPLEALYPGQAVFGESNVEALQVRLARAENENARLKLENRRLRAGSALVSWIKKGIRRLGRGSRRPDWS